jgi:hypothetical protein
MKQFLIDGFGAGTGNNGHIVGVITFDTSINQPNVNIFFLCIHSELFTAVEPITIAMAAGSFEKGSAVCFDLPDIFFSHEL